jgi:integrase
LCLPPAASRINGTPQEVPLNRTALLALGAEIPSLADGRVFRHWMHQRAFKEYWCETCRRVGIHDLHFHDLRHTFATRLRSVWITKSGRRFLAIVCPA